MLTKRQLEDAAKCPQNGLCTKCEMDCVRTLYNGYFGRRLQGCISEAAQTALAYREMLERLEWVEVGEREGKQEMIPAILCPSCDNWKEEGHAADCELATLLKGLEGESC